MLNVLKTISLAMLTIDAIAHCTVQHILADFSAALSISNYPARPAFRLTGTWRKKGAVEDSH
jgi:hypothetical protein